MRAKTTRIAAIATGVATSRTRETCFAATVRAKEHTAEAERLSGVAETADAEFQAARGL